MRRWILVIALPIIVSARAADMPDFEREQRLADEIVDVILDGDPEWLEADGREFLAIYTEADEPRAAVLILHGRGYHPDWADVANPLRVGLVDHGYATLSLQMPVLGKEAKYYDYVPIFPSAYPRIDAAVRWLREQGIDRVVLAAHSCSVHMSMAWLEQTATVIDGFVGIGMGATDYRQPMARPFPLARLQFPVLDVYGDEEYPAVIRHAPRRAEAIRSAGNARSSQIVVPEADHYFTDRGEALLETVTAWLNTL